MSHNHTKILIIRLSALGDIVNLTAIFSVLRDHYPEAQIDFVIKKHFQSIIDPNNYNINVIAYDAATGLTGWRKICRQLQGVKYDYFLDMHNNIRSKILKFYLKNVRTATFKKPRIRRFLLFYMLVNTFPKSFNLVSEYLKVLKILKINATYGKTEILLQQSVQDFAGELLRKKGIEKDFVVILPIAAWKNKRYDIARYLKVSQIIAARNDLFVVWLGGKNDAYLDQVEVDNRKIKIIIGETNLMQSMAILQKAMAVIGNDTGLTYAAEALKTPVLILEGPTARETGAGHCQYGSRVLEKNIWCRPCSQKGDRKCYRRQQACLDFAPEEVYEQFKPLITGEKK